MTRTRGRALIRGALAATAIAVGAWLAVGLQSARHEAAADRIGRSGDLSGGRFEQARDLYRDARHGNPGTDPERQEGRLLIVAGRMEQATRLLVDVVRREPENAHAWALLAVAAERADPALSRRSERKVGDLRADPDD
jgi:Tfp pilus assembly protein PilF